MSTYDFDDFVTEPKPIKPTVTVPLVIGTVAAAEKPVSRTGVHPAWAGLLAFLAVTFCVLWISTFFSGDWPSPNVDPVKGTYVAIFYDDIQKQEYTSDQLATIDSAVVTKFLHENVTGWKKIDVDQLDELKNLNPIYAEMAEVHRAKLPWVVVRSGRKLGSEPVTTPDELLNLVNRTAK